MKILFIGHDANRAGAQILLFQLLKWIKYKHTEIAFEILLGDEGDLLSEYLELSELKIFRKYLSKYTFIGKLTRLYLLREYKRKEFDLIYCNSIVNGRVLKLLSRLNVPIITHVHELDYWINNIGQANVNSIRVNSNKFIVPSQAVRNSLVDNFDFDDNKISTIGEFVEFNNLGLERLSIKEKLNLPSDCIVIGASGAENWRKGKDWFIPLALDILSRDIKKDIHLVWIGGTLNYELEHDYRHCNKYENIHFIEHLANANKYFHEFTAFAMLSREDPFPVVNLEAAGSGVPIVCFENSGGTPDLIVDGCGFVVPYADLHQFADKICLIIEDERLRKLISDNSIRVVKQKYDIDVIGEKIISIINYK